MDSLVEVTKYLLVKSVPERSVVEAEAGFQLESYA